MAYRSYSPPPFRHPRLVAASLVALVAVAVLAASVGASGRGGALGPTRMAASTTLVINEIDYDQPSTDTAEFVELRNIGSSGIDLDPYTIELVNGDLGGAAVYRSIDLPGHTLAAGDYYVVCGASANVPNCDLDLGVSSNLIQNGAPDAVAVMYGGAVVDTVSYEGDTGNPYTEDTGSGLADTGAEAAQGLSRYPDGTDSDHNSQDLSIRCVSPGEANRSDSDNCDEGTATPTATGGTPTPTATGEPPTPTATGETPTPAPTVTTEPPSATPTPPSPTPDGPTPTPEDPTATPDAPTAPPATPTPPPATPTPPPSTATSVPATPTGGPSTATPVQATATTTPDPLAVTMERFAAQRRGAGVVLRWRTASEVKHAGFHVYREPSGGKRERITRRPIPPAGSVLTGADYVLTDLGAPTVRTRYWVVDIDIHGAIAWHGPATVASRAVWRAAPAAGPRHPGTSAATVPW